jgi:hypothetical protein
MTFTYDETGPIKRIIVDWTSDDSAGTASGSTKKITGTIIKLVTDPDGTAAPTDDYDITLKDEDALDVLGQSQDDLTDRDTANVEQVFPFLLNYAGTPLAMAVFPPVCNVLTVAVTAAGNSKQGQLIIFWVPGMP